MKPPTALSSESDDLSALQPQKAQTAASRPVHRDLRQRRSTRSGSAPSTPRLHITDRAPAPPPEPGSLGAPIVIDEDEEGPISVPTDEKMEVDAPVEGLPNGKASSVMEDSRGAEGYPSPQPERKESVTSERLPDQVASAFQSASCVIVPEAELPAVGVPDAAVSAQKDLLNADTNSTTTLVVAEKKITTATLAQGGGGEKETMEISVECGENPSGPVVSGTTIEQPSGSEPLLDKVSPPTAVGVTAVPETGSTETTPFVPPATAPIAATTEAPPILTDELIKALLDMISKESGPSTDAQVLALDSAPDEKKILTPTSEASLKPSHGRACGRCPSGGRSTSFWDWEASKVSYP